MKRLLIILPSVGIGGMERIAVLSAELLKNDFEIRLCVYSRSECEYSVNNPVISMNIREGKTLLESLRFWTDGARAVAKLKREWQPDVIWSFGDPCNVINILSARPVKKEKIILSNHGATGKNLSNLVLQRYIYKRASNVICVSKMLSRTLAQNLMLKESKYFSVLYNPTDSDNIRAQAEREYTIKKEGSLIIGVGRLVFLKNFSLLLEAFSIIRASYPNAVLGIVGDGEERGRLEQLAKDLNISGSTIFFGYQTDYCYSVMRQADMLVSPSLSEGFPVTPLEAMALGVPVIASDCKTGYRELLAPETPISKVASGIEQASCGILLEPSSLDDSPEEKRKKAKSMADAICMLLENPTLSERLSAAGLRRIEALSTDEYRKKLLNIFRA